MTTPCSGQISFSNIQAEFGGVHPIRMPEYYGAAAGVPSSGTVALSQFRCKSAWVAAGTNVYEQSWSGASSLTLTRNTTGVTIILFAGGGGGGGANGSSSSTVGGGGGSGGYLYITKNLVAGTVLTWYVGFAGTGGGAGGPANVISGTTGGTSNISISTTGDFWECHGGGGGYSSGQAGSPGGGPTGNGLSGGVAPTGNTGGTGANAPQLWPSGTIIGYGGGGGGQTGGTGGLASGGGGGGGSADGGWRGAGGNGGSGYLKIIY